jgi:hypothetical protein
MKIGKMQSGIVDGNSRITAEVTWEDSCRPAQQIYFETPEPFGRDLTCSPHPFLVGAVLPAMRHGEKRILVEGPVCPELKIGLTSAMGLASAWHYGGAYPPLPIEAESEKRPPRSRPQRSGLFFSGGLDSLAMLRENRLNFPTDHPGSFRDALIVYGQNIESDNRFETYQKAVSALSHVTQEAGIELIPIHTNLRSLEESTHFFVYQYISAVMAAAGHAFADRLSSVTISASDSIPVSLRLMKQHHFQPYGSHPLLDPCYSSSSLRVRHDGLGLSRLDKTRLIAAWDVGLQNIRVCKKNWPGENCGRCEKCVRTLLGLLAAGVLEKAGNFSDKSLSESKIGLMPIEKQASKEDIATMADYMELIAPLQIQGRADFVYGIERLLERMRYHESELELLKKAVKRFDSRLLGGRLLKAKRSLQKR